MKFTRATFGQHKQGYVFPLIMGVNALEDCFAGVMQRIDTTDEFIFFYDKSFIISGASEKSFRMLGVRLVAGPGHRCTSSQCPSR